MNDLFDKLNVLVRAGINELLGEDHAVGQSRRRSVAPEKLGKDIDREIAALRERINEALAYEDELQARVQALNDEVARWDQQADEAVAGQNDTIARHAVEQMQSAQQRLAMAESDLYQHRLVTQELIQRVNLLDAVVADARRAQAEKEAATAPQEQVEKPSTGQVLSDVLRDAREKIAGMSDMIGTRQEVSPSNVKDEVVEDDLARRRERLSKPK